MSYIPTKGHKKVLAANYKDACNNYLLALLSMWDLDAKRGYWASDEVGGLYSYDGEFAINMQEIIFCVENDVPLSTFMNYTVYCVRCGEYNFNIPTLESYYNGCSVVPQETFDRLDALKDELNKCIEDTKSKF